MRNLYLTENRMSKNKMWCATIISLICVTYVQKDFYIRTLIKQFLTKYQIFFKLPHISHFHKNRNFLKYNNF